MAEDKKAKLGRPSLYKPEYCEQIIDYFSVEPYREVMKKITTKQGDVIEIPQNEANDFPSFAGFACEIDVDRDTLKEWCKVHPEFSAAYKKAKEYQERFLITTGLKGLVNPAFAIFTAKNVLRWTDRQEVEQNTNHSVSAQDMALLSEYIKKEKK